MVIFAGGSGSRLWPLSTPDYPKHLLKINGDHLSLVQHAYERAKQISDSVYVISEASHADHIRQQLEDLPDDALIVEPGRRGTASCIVAALHHIAARHSADEPIAFVHADHYIRDIAGFAHSFREAEQVSAHYKRIALVGIEADHPSTGFGYIEKGELLSDEPFVFEVKSFKEKPDYETARAYLESGNYLWNGGYFVGSINTFLEEMRQFAPDLLQNYERLSRASHEEYAQIYLSFESIAVDYALIEKAQNLIVVPASFDWMDLGSFSDLAKAASGDEIGNHFYGPSVVSEEVKNTFVHNQEEKPVIVIGLDNVVIVNTPEGLLVARKDLSQKVGDLSKKLQQK